MSLVHCDPQSNHDIILIDKPCDVDIQNSELGKKEMNFLVILVPVKPLIYPGINLIYTGNEPLRYAAIKTLDNSSKSNSFNSPGIKSIITIPESNIWEQNLLTKSHL